MFVLILSFKLLFLGAGWIGRKKRGNKHKLGFYRMFTADSNNTDNFLWTHIAMTQKTDFPGSWKTNNYFILGHKKLLLFTLYFLIKCPFFENILEFSNIAHLNIIFCRGDFHRLLFLLAEKTIGFHWIPHGHWHWYSLAWSHSVLKSCARAFAGFSQ